MNKTPKINRLFLVTVIWILLSGIFLGFIPFVRSMDATQLMLLSQLLYLMPVIGFMIINKVDPRKWMPFKPLKLSVIAMVILYAVLMIPVTSWLNLLSMLFVRNAFESSQSELTQNALWVNMIVMAVADFTPEQAKNLRSVVSIIMDIVREVCGVRFLDLHWHLV